MYTADKKHSNSVLHSHCKVYHCQTVAEVGGTKGGVCVIVGGENLGLKLLSRVDFVLEWTTMQGELDASSHIGKVEVSFVVDGGDRPEGETGLRGQFRTNAGQCVTNSVTRAIFATDRGHRIRTSSIRTGIS